MSGIRALAGGNCTDPPILGENAKGERNGTRPHSSKCMIDMGLAITIEKEETGASNNCFSMPKAKLR